MSRYSNAVQLALIASVTMGVSSCPAQKPDAYPAAGQACALPRDQLATLAGPMLQLPAKVFVDPAFSKSQREDIRQMAEQWNDFGRASLGLVFFEIADGDPAAFKPMPRGPKYCEAGEPRLPGIAFAREDSSEGWESEQVSADAEGVTRRCAVGDRNHSSEQQIVVATSRMPLDAFRSIALHELGHALGLGHSCAGDSRRASQYFRACEGLESDDPYKVAVMYPSLEVRGTSATDPYARLTPKEWLRTNDMERAYCLYRAVFGDKKPAVTMGASGASAQASSTP